MMKKNCVAIVFCVLFAWLFVFCCFAQNPNVLTYNGKTVNYGGNRNAGPIVIPKAYVAKTNEFRGVWVATQANIDFPVCPSAADFRREFKKVVDNLQKCGFTAVIFQVRPSNDAFYKSKVNPWSARMCGADGKTFGDEPNFDPMRFAIDETHARGLEFHAWFNPYRVANAVKVSKMDHIATLAPGNFARLHPECVLETKSANGSLLFLDPGNPLVMKFLLFTISEFIQAYDADAIHFDDYFYPYGDMGNVDAATYAKNNPKNLSLDDWRRENVNTLIHSISKLLNEANKNRAITVQFGISPFGIWANSPDPRKLKNNDGTPVKSMPGGSLTAGSQSYFSIYADTRKWVKNEWIDYVVPQLYWGFSNPVAPYAALADWWGDTVHGTSVRLYIGHAPYRMTLGHPDFANINEIRNQVLYNSGNPDIDGSVFFSYKHFFVGKDPKMMTVLNQLISFYCNPKAKR